jgi:hypothetical protein
MPQGPPLPQLATHCLLRKSQEKPAWQGGLMPQFIWQTPLTQVWLGWQAGPLPHLGVHMDPLQVSFAAQGGLFGPQPGRQAPFTQNWPKPQSGPPPQPTLHMSVP